MRNDLSCVVLIVDRSGSMDTCKEDATGGINQFIREQKELPGECLLTLVQFDQDCDDVYVDMPIDQVPEYSLIPRGSTSLLDAVGQTVARVGERLADLAEEDRPGLVTVVIVTDGQENTSREYTRERVMGMIKHQEDKYNWKFTYLGANQDAFAEAQSMGISPACAANYSTKMSGNAYGAVSSNITRMRSRTLSGEQVSCEYTSEERAGMVEDSSQE